MALTLSIAFTATPLAAGARMSVEATRQLSPGISFVSRGEFKQILTSASAAASPLDVLSAYTARFGPLIPGKKIVFRMRVLTQDGQSSQPLEQSVIVS